MQVCAAEEACLAGVRVDPTQHQQVSPLLLLEGFDAALQRRLVSHFATVWCGSLRRKDKVCSKEGILEEGANDNATGF